MNKKTVILCISAIAVLVAAVVVAVFFLYSDTGKDAPQTELSLQDGYGGLFLSVPSDAVAVFRFGEFRSFPETFSGNPYASFIFPQGSFRNFISQLASGDQKFGQAFSAAAILSFHQVGELEPLLIIDLNRNQSAVPEELLKLDTLARKCGLFTEIADCSWSAPEGSYLQKRRLMMISTSDVLLKSSQRHISRGVSILDQEYFQEAAASVQGAPNQLLLSNVNIAKIVSEYFKPLRKGLPDALRKTSEWTALSFGRLDSGKTSLSGGFFCADGNDRYINCLTSTSAAVSTSWEAMPSYTLYAYSLPISSVKESIEAYSAFADTGMGQGKYSAEQSRLTKQGGVSPVKWATDLSLKEVAVSSFFAGEDIETVLLVRISDKAVPDSLFKQYDFKAETPAAVEYPYKGYVSSLFGGLYSASEESYCTFIGRWLVVGSKSAIDEYVSGRALESTLSEQVAGAGFSVPSKTSNFLAYYTFTKEGRYVDKIFKPAYAEAVKTAYSGVFYSPAILSVSNVKGDNRLSLVLGTADAVKTKAPQFERDTIVVISKGPFEVKNCGTGKMNTFYQQDNLYLCLNDENGKGLWGAPFDTPICGRVAVIDYFNNGKLQFLFGAGSKLHLIDRLGRFVKPFPVDLDKEILLGPDAYDFNGSGRYNVMVLHKDNTIEMYNLQGRKPEQWKGITAPETILDLPQLVRSEGRSYWVVRTSLRTLIYSFYGGETITTYEGNDRIRPDSPVTPVKGGFEAVNFDGKKFVVRLK